jgi:sulfate permease, SulP family
VPQRFVSEESAIPFASAMRGVRARGYTSGDLRADLGAGLTLGVVALPLSMALAIASGAPPQLGLFTAIVGGTVIALAGGSMHSVSGPTAAFVVLLAPIVARYGLSGLLLASLMAGVVLVAMGLLRLGKLIQFIPHPVTTGFTAGIGVVIAVLQLGDLVGLGSLEGERIWERLADFGERLPAARWQDAAVAGVTLLVMIFFPKLTKRVPSPLVALAVAALAGVGLGRMGFEVATISSRFGGIPAVPPLPVLPWTVDGGITLSTIPELLPSALAIAMLGAIESLLCAVVADGMTGSRHDPDSELVGLGLGNIVVPFFGGFAATGAIARTATAIRSGGRTPVAAVIHAGFVMAAMLLFAPLLGYVPMAGMAGLLLVVAWNMSDARHFARIVRIAPRSDVMVLLVCFSLTVVFDMVIAVGVGVVLAALLFMRRMVEISGAQLVGGEHGHEATGLPPGVVFYDIAGPLFFGAAEKALRALTVVGSGVHTVIIDLEDVPAMDATGLVALESVVERLNGSDIRVVLVGVQAQPRRALERAGLVERGDRLEIHETVDDVLAGLGRSSDL